MPVCALYSSRALAVSCACASLFTARALKRPAASVSSSSIISSSADSRGFKVPRFCNSVDKRKRRTKTHTRTHKNTHANTRKVPQGLIVWGCAAK